MKPISSVYVLIPVLLLFSHLHESNATGQIDNACEGSLNKDMCMSTLKADPSHKGAELCDLAKIALKAARANATAMQKQISEMQMSESHTDLKKSLADCKENYESAVSQLQKSEEALESKRYNDVKTLVSAAKSDVVSCEHRIKEESHKASPLLNLNNIVKHQCSIVLGITNKLSNSGSTPSSPSTSSSPPTPSSSKVESVYRGDIGETKLFELAKTALKALITNATTIQKQISEIQIPDSQTDIKKSQADCKENYQNAVSQLQKCEEALDSKRYNDVKTLLSAAKSDIVSCEKRIKEENHMASPLLNLNNIAKHQCSIVLGITIKLSTSGSTPSSPSPSPPTSTSPPTSASTPTPSSSKVESTYRGDIGETKLFENAKTALKALITNATAIQKQISEFQIPDCPTDIKKSQADCKENYQNAVSQLQKCEEALESKRYNDAKTLASAAKRDIVSCGDRFKEESHKASPLLNLNNIVKHQCSIVLGIINKLCT